VELFLSDHGDRLNAVNADRVNAEVFGKKDILGKRGDVWAAVLDAHELLRPEVCGQSGKFESMVLDGLPERLAFGPIVGVRTGVWIKAAEFHTLVTEVRQFVHDLVEIVRRLLLVEDIRPAANGEFLLHVMSPENTLDS